MTTCHFQLYIPSFPCSTWSCLQAALYYAECEGWPVFPVVPAGKRPLVPQGFYQATTDTCQIRHWWHQWPDAGIGVPTGRDPATYQGTGLIVLDVDAKVNADTGLCGFDALHLLPLFLGYAPLPATRTVCTGGGGLHLFYTYPPAYSERIKSTTRLAGLSGLDVRADGGYVVVPPSLHSSGNSYRWIASGQLASYPPFLLTLSSLGPRRSAWSVCRPAQPDSLQRSGEVQASESTAVDYWCSVARSVAHKYGLPGKRNSVGFWLARRVVQAGLQAHDAQCVMQEYVSHVGAGDHEYTEQEALATLRSASMRT